MMRLALLAALALAATVSAEKGKCHWSQIPYPPVGGKNVTVPKVVLNLDLPPEKRWTKIVTPLAKDMNATVYQVVGLMRNKTRGFIEKVLTAEESHLWKLFGKNYTMELKGIEAATGTPIQWLAAMQLMYEVTGLCTSIVAQTPSGEVFHARNLDFGLFDGYSFKSDTWELTTKLRKIMLEVDVQSKGKTIIKLTTFAGFLGALTGVKPGAFGMSVDSRFDMNLDRYLIEWFLGKYQGQELTLFLRDRMINAKTYDEFHQQVLTARLMGPAYIIMSGTKAGEGAVVTREATKSVNDWTLSSQLKKGWFYLVETNYDHWKPPFILDDRRIPAERCMNETGASNINFANLFHVLSAKPVRNQLTTQSVLMHPASGKYESYKQACHAPCAPW